MKTKYPFQIDSIIHKSKGVFRTFGMEAMLFSPVEESETREPSAPLEMHEGFSRFKGTLIAKEGTKRTFVAFNIPAKEVPYIHKRTTMVMETALNKKLNKTVVPSVASGSSSKAYTVKLSSPMLKGKTAIQALMESASNKATVEKHIEFLEKNLSKFPNNQLQIDAINEAIELYESGKVEAANVESGSSGLIEIYSCPPKNVSPIDERGYSTIYDLTITFDESKNMPYEISSMNCLAPVDKSEGNKIIMSKADNKKTLSMALSENEWFSMINAMNNQKNLFESLTYPEQLKLAKKISDENRNKVV